MTRWLPYPLVSAALLAIWLLLNQSLSPAQILFGAALALIGPLILTRLDAPRLTIRNPSAILRLLGRVPVDVVRSNIAVTRNILSRRPPPSGFVHVPLRLRSPYGLAALACIITATPGTSWVSFDPSDGTLLMHVLDLGDEDWPAFIKQRYERLLLEIFE